MRGDRNGGRRLAGYLARWSGLSLLSKILLVLAFLATLAVVVIVLFVSYLLIGAYSGGNNPASINGLLFPLALIVLGVFGFPSSLVCALLWAGFAVSRRRGARRREPGEPSRSVR